MDGPGHRMKRPGAEERPPGPRDVDARRRRLRSRAGVVRLDAEGTVRHFDPLFASVLGYRPDALTGTFFFAYVHARDLAPILREAARLLQQRLGHQFRYCLAGAAELPIEDAVQAYPFNSQLVTLPSSTPGDRSMAIVAPLEAEEDVALITAPAVTSSGPNKIDLIAKGADNVLYHQVYDGAWRGWLPIGDGLASAPAVAVASGAATASSARSPRSSRVACRS